MVDIFKRWIAVAAIVTIVAAPLGVAHARHERRGPMHSCRLKMKRTLAVGAMLAMAALGSGCASLHGTGPLVNDQHLTPQHRVVQLDHGAQGGVLRSVLGQLATQQTFKRLDMRVLDFTLRHGNGGERYAVGFPVKVQTLADADAIVSGDANRSAYSARARRAGKPVTWALTGGGFVPRGSFSLDLGHGGSIRFSGGRLVSYSVLAPYENGTDQLSHARKNMSVDVPLTDARLRALPEGAEVTLVGKITRGSRVRLGHGATLTDLSAGFEVDASVGATRRSEKTELVTVRIKRLDGNKINVQVHKLDARQAEHSFGVHVGLDSDLAASLGVDGLTDRAISLVTRKIDKKLENYLRAGAQSQTSTLDQHTRVMSQTIDLGSGVSDRAGLRQHTAQHSSGSHAYLGTWDLFRYLSSTTVRNGTLSTTAGNIVYARAELRDVSKPIWPFRNFTGATTTDRELVSATFPGGETTHYLHLRYRVASDHHTSADDVRRVQALAQLFGGRASTSFEAHKMGKTNTVVDVYVSDAGLSAFANATPQQVKQAYSAAYDTLDHPARTRHAWRTAPWLNTTHAKYGEVMALLRAGTRGDSNNTRASTYYRITQRSFSKDAKAYAELTQLLALQSRIKAATTPLARAQAYADTQQQLGAQLGRSAATVATLATPANVLVNEISITPEHGAKLTYVHEGSIADPQQRIDGIVADPSTLHQVGASLQTN